MVQVGPLSFGTREEAERHVKVICSDNGYYREGRLSSQQVRSPNATESGASVHGGLIARASLFVLG